MEATGLSPVDSYRERAARWVVPYFGAMKLKDANALAINRWMVWLGEQRTLTGNPFSRTTLKGGWTTLRPFLRWATEQASLPDPTLGKRFKVRGAPERKKTWLTLDETKSVVAAILQEKPKWRAWLLILALSGCRSCEVTAIRWAAVDWAAGVIRLERSQRRGRIRDSLKSGGPREVPLIPALRDAMTAWQKECPRFDSDLVFPTRTGTPCQPGTTAKPIARVMARAGVDKHVSNHDLRRTLNKLLTKQQGKEVAMKMVGHVTDAMHGLYLNVEREEARVATEALAEALRLPGQVGKEVGTMPPDEA